MVFTVIRSAETLENSDFDCDEGDIKIQFNKLYTDDAVRININQIL
jgi:hypothetical protein